MKSGESRPIGTDPDGHRGTLAAIQIALGGNSNPNPLLIDAAADAEFALMIERLRGAAPTNKGGN